MSKKSAHKIVYSVFDVIFKDGQLIASKSFICLGQRKNLEAIVLNKADSPYEINKRSHNWLKVINYDYTEVLITSYNGAAAGFM